MSVHWELSPHKGLINTRSCPISSKSSMSTRLRRHQPPGSAEGQPHDQELATSQATSSSYRYWTATTTRSKLSPRGYVRGMVSQYVCIEQLHAADEKCLCVRRCRQESKPSQVYFASAAGPQCTSPGTFRSSTLHGAYVLPNEAATITSPCHSHCGTSGIRKDIYDTSCWAIKSQYANYP